MFKPNCAIGAINNYVSIHEFVISKELAHLFIKCCFKFYVQKKKTHCDTLLIRIIEGQYPVCSKWSSTISAVKGDFHVFCTAPKLISINFVYIFHCKCLLCFSYVFVVLRIVLPRDAVSLDNTRVVACSMCSSYWSNSWGPEGPLNNLFGSHDQFKSTQTLQAAAVLQRPSPVHTKKRKLVLDRIDGQEEAARFPQNKQRQKKRWPNIVVRYARITLIFINEQPMICFQH